MKYICGTPLILYLMTCLQAFKQISKDSSSPSVRGQGPLCACALEENGGFRACALRFSSAGCTTFTRSWAPHFYHSAVDSSSQTENLDLFGNFAMFFLLLKHIQISFLRIKNSYLYFIYIYILKIAMWANHLIDGRGCS